MFALWNVIIVLKAEGMCNSLKILAIEISF